MRDNLREGSIFFAVPNGGSRKMKTLRGGQQIPLEAIRLKKEGATAGVSDLILLSDIEPRILAIEVKTEKGRQSTAQVWWQGEAESAGVSYHIVRSVQDVVNLITQFGLRKKKRALSDLHQTDIDDFLTGDSEALPVDEPLI